MSLEKCQNNENLSIDEVLDKLSLLYTNAIDSLRSAIAAYVTDGQLPDADARKKGLFAYPELCVEWHGQIDHCVKTRAYARFVKPGQYRITVTQPDLFRQYLTEQLSILQQDYDVTFSVYPSQTEVPYPFVIDGSDLALDRSMSSSLAAHFPITDLADISDDITDGLFQSAEEMPLSHFDALRVDFSLARLKHYTGTPPEHVQPYILFTNYNRYVDEFVSWACEQVRDRIVVMLHYPV